MTSQFLQHSRKLQEKRRVHNKDVSLMTVKDWIRREWKRKAALRIKGLMTMRHMKIVLSN